MKSYVYILIALFTLSYPGRAIALHKFLKDKKITMKEAEILADNAAQGSKFPIVMNEEVLFQLNRMLVDRGHRKHLRESMHRMKKHEKLISKKLKQNHLPQELLAIPMVESGYQNIHSKHGWGSGLWMMIKLTAKSLGLKINQNTDQRLNVARSTDAALIYIKKNHKLLQDWNLTIMAYNMGENKVLKAMKRTGSKDAWKLVRKGHERDKGYLAKVIATAIILKNNSVIQK